MILAHKTGTLWRVATHQGWRGVRGLAARKAGAFLSWLQGSPHTEGIWAAYGDEALGLASLYDFTPADVLASQKIAEAASGPLPIGSLTWFIPDFQHPYYGGIHTILRFAEYFAREKGVHTQFVIVGGMNPARALKLIGSAFPALAAAPIRRVDSYQQLGRIPETDAAVATLWSTAYFALRFNAAKRKFYFLQDYEPLFYPAGSTYAQVEASYRFGFYGIANTPTLKTLYEGQHGGLAEYFVPCIDAEVFRPADAGVASGEPYKLLFYGRPEHPRNGFELGITALKKLKARLGDRVRIVSAGASWEPAFYGLDGIVENLGLLSYEDTAQLYRECTAGLVMMFTRHPSYLPLELMASGCLVVTNRNPATSWLLKDNGNCLLAEPSASCLAERLEHALLDAEARERIVGSAGRQVRASFGDWKAEMEKIFQYMCNPLAHRGS